MKTTLVKYSWKTKTTFVETYSGSQKKWKTKTIFTKTTLVLKKLGNDEDDICKKYSDPQKKWKTKTTFFKNTVVRRK